MNSPTAEERWALLPTGIRQQVDGYVLQDAFMQALRVVWEAGRGRGLGRNDAQQIVSDRYARLAIEALWDGDTVHDWFVVLLAVTEVPEKDSHLATIYWGTGERHLGGAETDGRSPHAAAATRAGQALASHLGVPFHFASPDTPDDEAPRWRVTR